VNAGLVGTPDVAEPSATTPPVKSSSADLTLHRASLWATIVVGLATIGVAVLTDGGQEDSLPTALRVAVVVAAAYLLPGLPIAALLRLPGVALTVVVAGPLSLATTIIAAQTQMVLGWWHPIPIQITIAAVAIVIAGVGLILRPPVAGPVRGWIGWDRQQWLNRAPWLAVLAAGLIVFWVAAETVQVADSDATGIITHVGPYYVIALLLVSVVVVRVLTTRALDLVLMAATVVTVIVVTSMLTAVASGAASFPTAYVHRGLIEILTYAGHLPPPSDARFSWAGFFSAAGQLTEVAGIPTADPFLQWAPVFNEITMIAPIYLIGRFVTARPKVAWLGVLLYSYFNWYQQDYFSPQATATFMYTSIVALLLWQFRASRVPRLPRFDGADTWALWFTARPTVRQLRGIGGWLRTVPSITDGTRYLARAAVATIRRTPGRVWGRGSVWTLSVEAVLVVVLAAMVVAHQLTPMVTIATLLLFSLLGATRYRLLWVAGVALFVAWFSFGASDYWVGHIHDLLNDVGQVQNAVDGGVAERLGADPTYQNMQYVRLLSSGFLIVLGLAGWFLIRRRRGWLLIGLITACPGGLVLVQSYGGEVIIRCLVLASPFLAPLAAVAVARLYGGLVHSCWRVRGNAPGPEFRRSVVAVGATTALVVMGLVLTANRGLNTSFEYTLKDQERLGSQLLERVPSESTVMAWGPSPTVVGPRLFTEVEVSRVDSLDCLADLSGCTFDRYPDYLFTSSQTRSALVLQYGYSAETIDHEVEKLLQSGDFVLMYKAGSTTILRNVDAPAIELN
jgi:hypothetical protein